MARKPRPGRTKAKPGSAPRRAATSADFRADLAKPAPSPLDFINRRMMEEDEEGEGDA